MEDDGSGLHWATSLMGPTVSGTFLVLIGLINLAVLVGILKVFMRMRRGEFDERQLEEQLDNRGLMNRFLGRATRAIRRPWQMYPLGVLFGLGFDTATEIALLATAGAAAAGGLPLYAILCLPIIFAAGMTLLDTIDGAFMNFAYGWAFSKPVRKVFYNITITALSVAVALMIGVVELLAVLAEKLVAVGGVWDVVAAVDLNYVGYAIAALFVVTWGVALAVWRFGRIEERWTAHLGAGDRGRGAAVTKAPRRAPLILRDLEQAEDAVRDGGMRLTAARRTVLAALFAADGPVSAEEIAAGLGGRVTLTEISSVYRNLELLEQLGVVRHLHAGHGPGRYVLEPPPSAATWRASRAGRS